MTAPYSDEPTGYRWDDQHTHRIMKPPPGRVIQAVTWCGLRALEVPGRGPVDCGKWRAITPPGLPRHDEGEPAVINAGDVDPDVTLLINDSGRYVLRTAGQCIEVDGDSLTQALARTKPVAALVARSEAPISRMSEPVRRSLTHFGCTLEEPQ